LHVWSFRFAYAILKRFAAAALGGSVIRSRYAFLSVAFAALVACGGQSSVVPATPQNTTGDARSTAAGTRHAHASPVNVVQNPGFETGDLTDWTQCGTVNAVISTVSHSGSYSARMGTTSKPEINGDSAICQNVTVPAAGQLTFWIKPATDDSITYVWQTAQLLSASGSVLQTFYKTATTSSAWEEESFDLSAYAGQAVTLKFDVHGTGYASDYVDQYVDDVSLSGSTSATPTPSPTSSASPTANPTSSPTTKPTSSPTAKPTSSPTASPTKSPTPAPSGSPCSQSQASGQSSTVTVVPFTSVTSAITSAHSVCLSAYVFTTAMYTALDTAAKSGEKVTVVLPNEEKSSDTTDAAQLTKDGATVVWDPGSPADHPLHAKLAVVDGVAYLDGRNWDTTDVTITDGNAADFAAIENALNLNPTSSTNLDTLKSVAIAREDAFITGAAPKTGVTVQFMSESFGSDANTVTALENAAKAGATVQVIVLSSDESGNSTEEAALTAMKADGIAIRLNPAGGSEKMTVISSQSTAWFGSANATSSTATTDNYIDWGMTVTNASVISSLQSYFTTTWSSSTAF
jgi:PLD-like domain